MTEHDQQSSGMEAAANAQPSQGRRRWVKGAMLATPAVMTLMSGRLASAASATCVQKNTLDGTILGQTTPDPTTGIYYIFRIEEGANGQGLVWKDTIDPNNPIVSVPSSYDEALEFGITPPAFGGSCLTSFA